MGLLSWGGIITGILIKKWALLAGSVCVTLAIVEVFCRLALPRPWFTPLSGNLLPGLVEAHPSRLYQLVPNFSASITGGSFQRMRIETNSHGLRERPLEPLRRSRLRILAVGDSFTFGMGIEGEQTWPAQLERVLLQRLSPSSSIAVVNAGIPGYGLTQIRDLTEELLLTLAPQLVILGVYAGGFDRLSDPYVALDHLLIRRSEIERVRAVEGGLIHSRMSRPSAIALDLWLETHWHSGALAFEGTNKLLRNARARLNVGGHSATATLQPQAAPATLHKGLEELRHIRNITRDRGISLVLLLIAGFDPSHQAYAMDKLANGAIEAFCAAEGIRIFNPTARLERSGGPVRLNAQDNHWSAPANAFVAQELASYLILQHVIGVAPQS